MVPGMEAAGITLIVAPASLVFIIIITQMYDCVNIVSVSYITIGIKKTRLEI